MCIYTDLVETNNGVVAVSNCCHNFKITYNNLILEHGFDGYVAFQKNVANCWHNVKNNEGQLERTIRFDSCQAGLSIIFNKKELAELKYLLDTGMIVYKRTLGVHEEMLTCDN